MQGIWGKLSTEQKVIVAVLGVVAIIAIFLAFSNSSKQKAALQQQQTTPAPVAQQAQVQYFNIGGFQNETLKKVVMGDKDGRTLYTFASDGKDVSNCTEACAENWPPYVFSDPKQFLVPPTIENLFTTFQRADGKGYQVSYLGKPLYYYKGDTAKGDAKGEGLNNGAWKVVDIQQAPNPTGGAAQTTPAPQQ